MSNLEIIESLSEIVEKQNIIIRAQAEALHQLGAMCMEEETQRVNELYNYFLGRGEAPDSAYEEGGESDVY